MKYIRSTPHAAAALLSALVVGRAQAHEPAHAVGLVWEETADTPSVLISNRGLVFADMESDELSLSLRCNEALGISTAAQPGVFLVEPDVLAVSTYQGVSDTADRGCSFQAGAGLPDASMSRAIATADGLLVTSRTTQIQAGVYGSGDGGHTFEERFLNQSGDYFEQLVSAPSDPARVYGSGLRLGDGTRTNVCGVSEDSGMTWNIHELSGAITPFGVHPTDPNVVFGYEPIDPQETRFRVLRSDDGCATFATELLDNVVHPTAVAGSGEGSVFLGIDAGGGLYHSVDDGLSFERVLPNEVYSVTCLEQRGERLWICANLAPNINGIWYTDDSATTLEKFMAFSDVSRPVTCDDSAARALCAGPWYDFYSELHPVVATPDAGVSDAGQPMPDAAVAVPDAGVADAGVVADAGTDPGKTGGGGCSAVGPAAAAFPAGLFPLAALAWLATRRRRACTARS